MFRTVLLAALAAAVAAQGSLKKILVLDSGNYGMVVDSKAAVVFAVADGKTFEGGPELAKELEGLARVAVFDTENKAEFVASKKLGDDKFFAKKYGEEEKMEPYATIDEAKAAAVESLPTDTVAEMTDYVKIQQWLMTVTAQNKLPAMLFIDKEDYDGVPALMQKLSYWVDDSFQLAVVPNGSPELKQQLGITQTPFLMVMIPQETENEKDPDGPKSTGFQGAGYNKEQFGAMKFKNVMKFLGMVRSEMGQKGYFKQQDTSAPKKEKSKPVKTVPLFELTAETADACSAGKLGLCIITMIDGSPLNEQKEEQLQVMRDVQNAPSMKGRILTFVWVDHSCHPSFGNYFASGSELFLPAVVAVSAKKSAFAQHLGANDKTKIGAFIGGVLGGKVKIGKMPGDGEVPTISADDDCEAAHTAMMPPEEEDLDEDIMKEMQEEEEKAREVAAAADAANVVEDPEIEAKRMRAQAEADRMNKWSNKKSKKGKGKKKKKKNKKKKSKAKTEL